MSATSGGHGGDGSVELEDEDGSEEELSSTPAVKRKCVCNEDSVPLVPDIPLEKYADFLRACYTQHELTSTKWPHLDARKYVKLAVINIYYLIGKKVIWLDIARVCGRIFTSRRRVKIQHKSAISSHITFLTIK